MAIYKFSQGGGGKIVKMGKRKKVEGGKKEGLLKELDTKVLSRMPSLTIEVLDSFFV